MTRAILKLTRSSSPPKEHSSLAGHRVSAMHRALPYLHVPSSHQAISGGNTHVDESNLNMGYFERQLQNISYVSKDDKHPQKLLRG
jgi:hypothetical protein